MPVNVIAHDTRLEGRTPVSTSGAVAFEVDGETPLDDFFERVVQLSDRSGGIRNLFIMAHGVHVTGEDTTAVQFCREFISYRTVHHFARLRDKVRHIVLFVCHASETSMTAHGDGDELCRQMAIQAQTEVTAAREVQAYRRDERCLLFFCEESSIDFGEWEGPVIVYDRTGNVIAQYNNPSAWRGADGALHDPRRESDPRISGERRGADPRLDASRHSMRL